jgi:hypothetical protein
LNLDEKRRPRETFGGYSDGRRECGSVSGAILEVMSSAPGELKVSDVQARVGELLQGEVSRFTVADHLLKHSQGESRRYERTRRGYYRFVG